VQPFEKQRGGLARTNIADDAAHAVRSGEKRVSGVIADESAASAERLREFDDGCSMHTSSQNVRLT
jgi:hypothetical protein